MSNYDCTGNVSEDIMLVNKTVAKIMENIQARGIDVRFDEAVIKLILKKLDLMEQRLVENVQEKILVNTFGDYSLVPLFDNMSDWVASTNGDIPSIVAKAVNAVVEKDPSRKNHGPSSAGKILIREVGSAIHRVCRLDAENREGLEPWRRGEIRPIAVSTGFGRKRPAISTSPNDNFLDQVRVNVYAEFWKHGGISIVDVLNTIVETQSLDDKTKEAAIDSVLDSLVSGIFSVLRWTEEARDDRHIDRMVQTEINNLHEKYNDEADTVNGLKGQDRAVRIMTAMKEILDLVDPVAGFNSYWYITGRYTEVLNSVNSLDTHDRIEGVKYRRALQHAAYMGRRN